MPSERLLNLIRAEFDRLSAAAVAELLLSPQVSAELLVSSTAEAGPAMWIVNRSDVYDESLEALTRHPLSEIASRAHVKLSARRSGLVPLSPPELPADFGEIPDYGVEDVLGHPLAPFAVMLHYASSKNEDERASAALSLTRRLLEHPPHWLAMDPERAQIVRVFGERLLRDESAFARTYCARIPVLEAAQILSAIRTEKNPHVFAKLLQNPALNREGLDAALARLGESPELRTPEVSQVAALDRRWSGPERKRLLDLANGDPLAHAIHDWYLAGS